MSFRWALSHRYSADKVTQSDNEDGQERIRHLRAHEEPLLEPSLQHKLLCVHEDHVVLPNEESRNSNHFLYLFVDFVAVGEAALAADWITAWKTSGEAALAADFYGAEP